MFSYFMKIQRSFISFCDKHTILCLTISDLQSHERLLYFLVTVLFMCRLMVFFFTIYMTVYLFSCNTYFTHVVTTSYFSVYVYTESLVGAVPSLGI